MRFRFLNTKKIQFSLICSGILLSQTACGLFQPQGPYQTGLTIEQTSTETRDSTSYYFSEGMNKPLESKGVIGSGDTCADARKNSGTLDLKSQFVVKTHSEVIGQSESSHPLIPGKDEFDSAFVSILETITNKSGKTDKTESFVDLYGNQKSWSEKSRVEQPKETLASFKAIAADEYVVGFHSIGDLWKDLSDDGAELFTELLTRHNPQTDDIWSSLNGQTLYITQNYEDVSLGKENVSAVQLDLITTANVDPTAAAIKDDCLIKTNQQFASNKTGVDDTKVESITLDPGCETAFTFQKIGKEWWHKDVMIKAERTYYEVDITDFGYEWYEESSDSCTRKSATSKPSGNSRPFVIYTVTKVTQILDTDSFEIIEEVQP